MVFKLSGVRRKTFCSTGLAIMYRTAGPKTLRVDKVGDFLEMDCADLSDLRGSIQLLDGNMTSVVIAFEFSCDPYGEALFFEPDTATRLSSIGSGMASTSSISCKGFARVRMRVITATGTANSIGSARMCSYTEVV